MSEEYKDFLLKLSQLSEPPIANEEEVSHVVYSAIQTDFPQIKLEDLDIFKSIATKQTVSKFPITQQYLDGLLWGSGEEPDKELAAKYQDLLFTTVITPILELLRLPLANEISQQKILKFLDHYHPISQDNFVAKLISSLQDKEEKTTDSFDSITGIEENQIGGSDIIENEDPDDFVWESMSAGSNDNLEQGFEYTTANELALTLKSKLSWQSQIISIFSKIESEFIINSPQFDKSTIFSVINNLLRHYFDHPSPEIENLVVIFAFIIRDSFGKKMDEIPNTLEKYLSLFTTTKDNDEEIEEKNEFYLIKFILINLFFTLSKEIEKNKKEIPRNVKIVFNKSLLGNIELIKDQMEFIEKQLKKYPQKAEEIFIELNELFEILKYLTVQEPVGQLNSDVSDKLLTSELIRVFIQLFILLHSSYLPSLIFDQVTELFILFNIYQPDLNLFFIQVKKVTEILNNENFIKQFPQIYFNFYAISYLYSQRSNKLLPAWQNICSFFSLF